MINYKTSLWQEQRGQPYYRIQTNDLVVTIKLRRRIAFKLVCCGINATLWLFRGTYSTPYKAKISLQRLTGQKVKKDAITGGYAVETTPILNPKSIS